MEEDGVGMMYVGKKECGVDVNVDVAANVDLDVHIAVGVDVKCGVNVDGLLIRQ